MYISSYPCLSFFSTGRRLIFENMYLGDSHVLLNTLCWCCHRKIWLHSGEACRLCRTAPPRPWDECPAWAGTPWIDTQRSSNSGMEPMVPSYWDEALSLGNWLPLKSKFYSSTHISSSTTHCQHHLNPTLWAFHHWKISKGEWVEGTVESLRRWFLQAGWLLALECSRQRS